ncbi:MAG: hypothetical protein A2275_03820 [Bacteroidetes bacterium RIFOXYA12_FULL_35_11]|nr:MAG: hypothetical protein A2X01_02760 [Bacteroidetes bacterium GWF2_35_48]OFY73420.1 MAG: hypothetical protein A2275_03820 [Bacteroidetes bacterium RIFOXYA12_FULL_35_11]OFY92452.1 MAG: hypothetical protein A2309_01290 [Bacteroidetes bacterium RIFOXYB2_FULL_35_7]HBX51284.1 phosphatase PAP2 family protein [Bacteroidales bacterium]
MFDQLQQLDTNLFLFLNGLHSPVMDKPMWYLSQHLPWIPLYILVIWFAIRKFKMNAIVIIALLFITWGLCDLFSDTIKHAVQRYRPTHNTIIGDLVHTVNGYRGGKYGFVSSHSANSFGVALMIVLLFKNKEWTRFLFIWPVIVAYTRIYLGVHYPSDIFCGALTGFATAFVIYLLYVKFLQKYNLNNLHFKE